MKARSHAQLWIVIEVAAVLTALGALAAGVGACERARRAGGDDPAAAPQPIRRVGFGPQPAFAQSAINSKTVSIADVVQRVLPSVVNIASTKIVHPSQSPLFYDPLFRELFQRFFHDGYRAHDRRLRALGSGVIVDASGLVLTNNHVVDKADSIRVTLHDGRELDAKVVGTDAKTDIAVLRLQGTKGLTLVPMKMGDSDTLRLGEVVIAIGNPFGVGQTVTMGIVSATGRANVGLAEYEDFIQTDAAINPGNSGGPLVNMQAELIGINTAILTRSGGQIGIGFAIPSTMAQQVERSILAHGRVVRGWLGASIQTLTPDLAAALGIPGRHGVVISAVVSGSPAEKAGLRLDDVVVSIDGHAVQAAGKLRYLVANAGPGATIKLDVLRKTGALTLRAKLGDLAARKPPRFEIGKSEGLLGGLRVTRLDSAARSQYRIPLGVTGIVVDKVQPGSPAAAAGIRRGDVLIALDHKPLRTVADFRRAYRAAEQRALLLAYRSGATIYLLLRKRR